MKRSLWELYEELKDREIIEEFEKDERDKKAGFYTVDEILRK